MGLHINLNTGLCPKYKANTTKLGDIMVKTHEEKCAQEKFYGRILDFLSFLFSFGLASEVPKLTHYGVV